MPSAVLPSAVLWDMDGTIVDTEPYWIAAEAPLVEEHGGSWTHQDALQLVGLSLDASARILQDAGVRLTVDEIIATLSARVVAMCAERGVPFRPGALEMLHDLRAAGVKTGLVTMSYRHMALSIVELIGFQAFDVVIAGDDARRPKPHPDPYLQAAEALGVDIAHTVAIEDSPNGLRSAIASGAVALGVPNILPLDGIGAHALWPTLEGRTAADLGALHVAHHTTAAVHGDAR
ncbi:HAD family hydrolase [Microbacterium marinilacus]|uniref:HAD family hydrolase n=1 Tax=Microbacterium marinilacus TaxID=415209 RepID=UPI002484D0E4|nr:HAD family hydrolase [Microbacterium marinilacus]